MVRRGATVGATFKYLTDCINAPGVDGMTYGEAGDAINTMKEASHMVSRATFLSRINLYELRQIETQLGYATHHTNGLTMAGDFHVSYHKGAFKGRPCYYFTHSAIEYIFTEGGK